MIVIINNDLEIHEQIKTNVMKSPKLWNLISLVFTCLCMTVMGLKLNWLGVEHG